MKKLAKLDTTDSIAIAELVADARRACTRAEEPAPAGWTTAGGPTDALSLDEESEANADASYAVDMEG